MNHTVVHHQVIINAALKELYSFRTNEVVNLVCTAGVVKDVPAAASTLHPRGVAA